MRNNDGLPGIQTARVSNACNYEIAIKTHFSYSELMSSASDAAEFQERHTQGGCPAFVTLEIPELMPQRVFEQILQKRHHFFQEPSLDPYSSASESPERKRAVAQISGHWVDQIALPLNRLIRRRGEELGRQLGLAPFRIGHIECKCIAFSNGASFKPHSDLHGGAVVAQRRLTWVYYTHREPRPFTGGNLVFHRQGVRIGEVAPVAGRLVIFRSDTIHEVEPVHIPSDDFANCRFGLTGFVYEYPSLSHRVNCIGRMIWGNLPLHAETRRRIRRILRRIPQTIR